MRTTRLWTLLHILYHIATTKKRQSYKNIEIYSFAGMRVRGVTQATIIHLPATQEDLRGRPRGLVEEMRVLPAGLRIGLSNPPGNSSAVDASRAAAKVAAVLRLGRLNPSSRSRMVTALTLTKRVSSSCANFAQREESNARLMSALSSRVARKLLGYGGCGDCSSDINWKA